MLQAVTASFALPSKHWRWAVGWVGRIAEFGAMQLLVQVLGGVAGILIIRSMSKPDYVLYAIVFQMQTAANMLADLGVGIGVRSIGGRVWGDPERLGSLVKTGLMVRHQFATFSLAVTVPAALWMLLSNGADWWTASLLCCVLIVGILPILGSSVHLVPVQLHGEYRRLQKLDFANALLRLLLVGAIALTGMTAALATAVGAAGNWLQFRWLRRWSQDHASPLAGPNQDDHRELLQVSKRVFPNAVFFCVQGQVTLLILTVMDNQSGIADVTALGRLAILLTAFSAMVTNLLVPRFARCQQQKRVIRMYIGLVGATAFVLAPVVLLGWYYPAILLWVLGEKFSGLATDCGWVVLTACFGQLGATMWHLNVSKGWIRMQTLLFIPVTLASQIIAAIYLDLREFRDILIFGLVSTVAPLPLSMLDAIIGVCDERVEEQVLRC